MPKRTGFLYEDVISFDNCMLAEKEMLKGKRNNRTAKRMRKEPERYAKLVQDALLNDWEPHPYRERVIFDSHRHKYRNLKIPCLEDQAVHHAIMRVTVPHIMRRNYFYNCGSIPNAGQIRVVRAIRRWLSRKTKVKYGATLDVQKFYDNLPHWVVMQALERMFKDKKFLALHASILRGMSKNGVGIAIGFYPSAWYANIALSHIDRILEAAKGIRFSRFMDDIAIVANSKRAIHKAIKLVSDKLISLSLKLKYNWQVFQIKQRGLSFLSYRFFHGYTIMQKGVMYRVSRRLRHAKPLTLKKARSITSTMGILKHCSSFNFRKHFVYPYVSIKKCKEMISREEKNRVRAMPACV